MQAQRTKLRDYSERVVVARQLGVAFGDGLVAPERRRGRGAASNETGRFEPIKREEFDDGWERGRKARSRSRPKSFTNARAPSSRAMNRPIFPSTVRSIPIAAASTAASIVSRGRPTPMSACRRGSISRASCSSRTAPRRCSNANSRRRTIAPRTIALGTNTDPYQPIERQYRVTRSILEVLARYDHPVGIVTKSNLVLRDLDILGADGRQGARQSLCFGDDAR